MRIDIMTLFPETVGDIMDESILPRAQERDLIKIECHQIRDYTTNKQNQVDDYPYGGGHGAVLQADPLFRCWDHICKEVGHRVYTIYMSPCGTTFCQAEAKRLSREYENLILVCGHYEGIDERFIEECVDEEMSLGDFVLTGGEYAAMAIADAVCRLCPGVLSDPECYENRELLTHTVTAEIPLEGINNEYCIGFYLKNSLGQFARLDNSIEYKNGYHILCKAIR